MKFKLLVTLATFAFTPLFSAQAEDHMPNMEKHHEKMAKDLHLTSEQSTKIKEIHKSQQEKIKEAMGDIKEKMKAFKDSYLNEKALDTDVTAAHEALLTARKKIQDIQFQGMLEIRKILNSDQKKKFLEKMDKMFGGHKMNDHDMKKHKE